MIEFSYEKATSSNQAAQSLAARSNAKLLGGGTNLVDLMRENIEQPSHIIDVTQLSRAIEATPQGGLYIGSAVTNTDLANHSQVKTRYPMLSKAILFGASAQIRNMATVAGNLMQRTRCYYFYDGATRCNKRSPGSGCDAIEGFHRIHAVLGASSFCIATHPSDMCVALAALDAVVHVQSHTATREIPFEDFHKLPETTPHIETELKDDEVITGITLPPCAVARHSDYQKVRDRASYAFALVSVAAALTLDGDTISEVRLALGGVAHKPWRARTAEHSLTGAPANDTSFRQAADAELELAHGYAGNKFKIELARRSIINTLQGLVKRAKEHQQQ